MALGPDKQSSGGIQLLYKWDREKIMRLTKAAIRMCRDTWVWTRLGGVVIHKPETHDYTHLMAYRFISLMRCIAKVVEQVVAAQLSDEVKGSGLLSEGQLGSRRGQSTIHAAGIIVERSHPL
jgi:hypothetical protein